MPCSCTGANAQRDYTALLGQCVIKAPSLDQHNYEGSILKKLLLCTEGTAEIEPLSSEKRDRVYKGSEDTPLEVSSSVINILPVHLLSIRDIFGHAWYASYITDEGLRNPF